MSKPAKLSETLPMDSAALSRAGVHNLESEVMASALVMIKNNPDLSIGEALDQALREWDA